MKNKLFNVTFVSSTCTHVQVGRQHYLLIDLLNGEFEIWFTHVTDEDTSLYVTTRKEFYEFRIAFNGAMGIPLKDKFRFLRSVWLLLNRQREFARIVKNKSINDIVELVNQKSI